jgi:hypothetical protein
MPQTHSVQTTLRHLKNWPVEGQLKVCPLCSTLKVNENEECFACTWHGCFEDNQTMVRMRLAELATQCPEIIALWDEPKSLTRWEWIRGIAKSYWMRLTRRHINIQA